MSQLTRKDVIAKNREHFSRPGARLGYVDGTCFYRLDADPESPVRCGFGVLIPDELYHPDMEGMDAVGICDAYAEIAVLFAEDVVPENFLHELQRIHDRTATLYEITDMGKVRMFLFELDHLEQAYGLDVA